MFTVFYLKCLIMSLICLFFSVEGLQPDESSFLINKRIEIKWLELSTCPLSPSMPYQVGADIEGKGPDNLTPPDCITMYSPQYTEANISLLSGFLNRHFKGSDECDSSRTVKSQWARGTAMSGWSEDLSDLDGVYGVLRSDSWEGARPWSALWTNSKILKWILELTGSHFWKASTGSVPSV